MADLVQKLQAIKNNGNAADLLYELEFEDTGFILEHLAATMIRVIIYRSAIKDAQRPETKDAYLRAAQEHFAKLSALTRIFMRDNTLNQKVFDLVRAYNKKTDELFPLEPVDFVENGDAGIAFKIVPFRV